MIQLVSNKVSGQEYFKYLVQELREIYKYIKFLNENALNDFPERNFSIEKITPLANFFLPEEIKIKTKNKDFVPDFAVFNNKEIEPLLVKSIEDFYNENFKKFINKKLTIRKLSEMAYRTILHKYYNFLSQYFKHLFSIAKFLNENELNELSKTKNPLKKEFIRKKYFSFASRIQSQMSPNELLLLFYNTLVFPEWNLYVYRYKLLRNIREVDLIEERHKFLYRKKKIEGEDYKALKFRTDLLNFKISNKKPR